MPSEIDALIKRLEDPESTFTTAEVCKLLEWTSANATELAETSKVVELAKQANDELLQRMQSQWDWLKGQVSRSEPIKLRKVSYR